MRINKHDILQNLFNKYYGNASALLDKNLSLGLTAYDLPRIISVTSEMPMYSRTFFNDERIVSYHLGGYSTCFSDAFFRLSGEAVERYSSLMTPKNFIEDFKFLSANELAGKSLLPLSYINVYTDQQYQQLNSINHSFADAKLSSDEKIHWIELTNIIDWTKVYVPSQMVFLSGHSFDSKQYNPSFTTGTACHQTKEKAIINAIVESIQLHDFIDAWYLNNQKFTNLIIDESSTKNQIFNIFKNDNFKINFWYIKHEILPIHTVVCYIEALNNYLPKYSFGLQSGFEIKQVMERAFLEALAVFDFITYGSIFNSLKDKNSVALDKDKLNLDDNALTYALNKDRLPENWISGIKSNIEENINLSNLINLDKQKNLDKLIDDKEFLKFLINECKKKYQYLFIVDITAPELNLDYHVMRVLIPENLPVIFPNFFPWNHPHALKQKISQKNVYIHPLP